jgi:hypothetical protein
MVLRVYIRQNITKQYAFLLAFMYSTLTCIVNPNFYRLSSVRNSVAEPKIFLSAPAPERFKRYRENYFF